MRENQDPCQVWRNEIERLHQGISDFEEVLASGEAPPDGRMCSATD